MVQFVAQRTLLPKMVHRKTRMFPFITKTWNPVVGCPHNCKYCWAKKLAEQRLGYESFLISRRIDKRLNQSFKKDDFVFVCDMGDLWAKNVPFEWQRSVMANIEGYPETSFLLLTKNPHGYLTYMRKWGLFPDNCILGCTIETNRSITKNFSFAPVPETRFGNMAWIHHRKMLSIEPIMDFDLHPFFNRILTVQPESVAIGYDNYKNQLPEPSLAKTLKLIGLLEKEGIKVYRKALREANDQLTLLEANP